MSFDDFNVTSPISGTVPAAPIANFSSAQVPGTLNVNFTDTSTGGAPTSWSWDFGDGSGSTSQSPSHAYAGPGNYQVKLTATNNGGFTSKTSTITVNPLPGVPVASFSAVQQGGSLAVQFTDTSTNSPSSWSWNFGDGHTSANQNPLHTFAHAGTYTVTLHATNGAGTGTTSQSVTVNAVVPGATYHSLTPARILDTRIGTGLSGKFVSTVPREFAVTGAGGVPSGAIAVTGNLTVTGQTGAGFVALTLTAQSHPTTSTLNFPLGDSRANGVTVPLTAGHLWATYVAASSLATTNLIFDVTGYFTPDASGATYHSLTPARILDTRTAPA